MGLVPRSLMYLASELYGIIPYSDILCTAYAHGYLEGPALRFLSTVSMEQRTGGLMSLRSRVRHATPYSAHALLHAILCSDASHWS